jgi:hypothetical protein
MSTMSEYENPIPKIDSFPAPEIEAVEYQFTVVPFTVYDSGGWSAGNYKVISDPSLENVPSELKDVDPDNTKLAWLEFYQRSVTRVRHPVRFEGDKPGPWPVVKGDPEKNEKIYGREFPAAEPQLLVNADNAESSYATVSQILEQGTITPFMRQWLTRYSQEPGASGSNRFLLKLLPVLDLQLGKDLVNNKFRYHNVNFHNLLKEAA